VILSDPCHPDDTVLPTAITSSIRTNVNRKLPWGERESSPQNKKEEKGRNKFLTQSERPIHFSEITCMYIHTYILYSTTREKKECGRIRVPE
jgi:hypothetical protein